MTKAEEKIIELQQKQQQRRDEILIKRPPKTPTK